MKLTPTDLSQNVFDLIGNKWALIGAYDKNKDGISYNAMTASWGGLGVLWNKNVFWCFVRPQRYTKEFIDNSDLISLSFFEEQYRQALTFCGRVSGRDCDKISKAGLSPIVTDGTLTFKESTLTIIGKKIYESKIYPEGFIDKQLIDMHYPNSDFHTVYVCEIVDIDAK